MWFTDVLSRVGQYAYGQANAAYVMLTDTQGTPLSTPGGALSTFETAAMGYDPSIGRTPVELSNSAGSALLTNTTLSATIKAAPGFMHGLSVTVVGSNAAATHLAIYDNSAPSGNPLHVLPLPAPGAVMPTMMFDELFTAGLTMAAVTVSNAGVLTPAASLTGIAILLNVSYR